MLNNLKSIFALTEEKGCAIPAFNCYTQECVMGILKAAKETGAPVIFQMFSRLADTNDGNFVAPAILEAIRQLPQPAVMVGTAHGRYKKAPVLDIQRIRDIREATGVLPLVLHGGSGVPDDQIRMAVEAIIRKVNFATDLCYAFLDQVMVTERTTVALDVFMREPIHAIRDYCISKIKLLGADKI